MNRMFAGWRMRYVAHATKTSACLFCTLRRKGDDRARWILERAPKAFVVLNAFPYNSGHVMIAVNRHVGTMHGLSPAERTEVRRLLDRVERAIQRVYRPEGINVGINLGRAAGAGVDGHLHVHVVPRWNGDTNFMSTVGETRVLPEDLTATFDRMAAALSALRR
jgi:ATP adenylyltransferase